MREQGEPGDPKLPPDPYLDVFNPADWKDPTRHPDYHRSRVPLDGYPGDFFKDADELRKVALIVHMHLDLETEFVLQDGLTMYLQGRLPEKTLRYQLYQARVGDTRPWCLDLIDAEEKTIDSYQPYDLWEALDSLSQYLA